MVDRSNGFLIVYIHACIYVYTCVYTYAGIYIHIYELSYPVLLEHKIKP